MWGPRSLASVLRSHPVPCGGVGGSGPQAGCAGPRLHRRNRPSVTRCHRSTTVTRVGRRPSWKQAAVPAKALCPHLQERPSSPGRKHGAPRRVPGKEAAQRHRGQEGGALGLPSAPPDLLGPRLCLRPVRPAPPCGDDPPFLWGSLLSALVQAAPPHAAAGHGKGLRSARRPTAREVRVGPVFGTEPRQAVRGAPPTQQKVAGCSAAVQKMNPIFHSVIINISLQMVLIFLKLWLSKGPLCEYLRKKGRKSAAEEGSGR